MSIMLREVRSNVMAGSAADDAAVAVYPYTEKGTLVRAYIENLSLVTANGSNNITVTATQNSTTIFSRATTSDNLVANTCPEQTLAAAMVGDKLEVSKGDVITFAVAKGGTGPAYELNVVLVYRLAN